MGVDRIRLARALAAIAADSWQPTELPERLCTACLTVLPVDGVGVSLMSRDEPGGRALLGASDTVSTRIEELQLGISTGDALARLRAYAFRYSLPLLAVAADVMAGTLRLTSEER